MFSCWPSSSWGPADVIVFEKPELSYYWPGSSWMWEIVPVDSNNSPAVSIHKCRKLLLFLFYDFDVKTFGCFDGFPKLSSFPPFFTLIA